MPKPADETKPEPEADDHDREKALDRTLDILDRLVAVLERDRERAPDTRTLDDRIAAVQLELEDVPRRGHAEVTTRAGGTYTYDYILEADLMKAIRPLLAKHGIATYYSDRLLRWSDGTAEVEVELRFRANDEERACTAVGTGSDIGDKAANKAKTSAVRYLLWKTFLQPSDEDPEQENVEGDAAAAAAAGRAEATRRRGTARRQPPADTRGRLIQRINQLAVELDEIQGKTAGDTLAALPEKARTAIGFEGDWPNGLSDDELVSVGKQLGQHVTNERAEKEKNPDAYTPTEFELRVAE